MTDTNKKKTDDEKVTKKEVVKKEVAKKEVAKKDVVKKDVTKKEAVAKKDSKEFSGKYIPAIGRRKTAVAQVRMYEKGSGQIIVNGVDGLEYFKKEEGLSLALQPLKTVSKLKDFDFSVIIKGGGFSSQIGALSHGIARALVKLDPEFKIILKTGSYLTRDPRKKERKKPGLKKARKAPQWSKR